MPTHLGRAAYAQVTRSDSPQCGLDTYDTRNRVDRPQPLEAQRRTSVATNRTTPVVLAPIVWPVAVGSTIRVSIQPPRPGGRVVQPTLEVPGRISHRADDRIEDEPRSRADVTSTVDPPDPVMSLNALLPVTVQAALRLACRGVRRDQFPPGRSAATRDRNAGPRPTGDGPARTLLAD